jgi:predicted metal-dependent enzyme (double-stranded beta helix superfamily)
MYDIFELGSGDMDAAAAGRLPLLNRFCRDIANVLAAEALCDVPRRVAGLLPGLLRQADLLTPSQRGAPLDAYGRNRIFICPNDRFSVLAMVWPPGVTTPIHDHRDWCAIGVYEGMIEETYYAPATGSPDCTIAVASRTVCHQPGDIAHMPTNAPNIHSIHNPTDKVAISIHVYGGNCETLGPNLDKVYSLQG